MDLQEIRSYFPHTRHLIYLNHAATAPLSIPVREAIDKHLRERSEGPVENYARVISEINATRKQLAGLMGVELATVDFAPNTSSALNILALGLDWRPGDRVLLPGCEFPANVYPFMNLKRLGVEVAFLPHTSGVFALDDLDEALRPPVRLLSLSWVQFLSGFRADIRKIGAMCRDRGVLFCVDGIQGFGAVRLPSGLEDCGVDFFASGTHKWLMGTQGLAVYYCSRALEDRLEPVEIGWLHGPVDWNRFFDYRLEFHPDVRKFRTGTMNHLGIRALRAALKFYESLSPEWCESRVLALARRLAGGLEEIGLKQYGSFAPEAGSGIVAFEHPDPPAAHRRLDDAGISIALRNNLLRFAPTWYNSEDEIDRTVATLESISRRD